MSREVSTQGFSHVALVCSDMYETTRFWEALGMPLVKIEDLPNGGQYSFHDIGHGAMLSYVYFPDAPPPAPGIASQHPEVRRHGVKTAIGSMNHVAMRLPPERFDAVLATLRAKGIEVHAVDHGAGSGSEGAPAAGAWIRSMYFRDPDNIAFEFASLLRELGATEDLAPRVRNARGDAVDYVPSLRRGEGVKLGL